ncbi:MAG: S8 family serine peptidase, partial [Nitrospirae bacterium]|nr:S8 family serine peptidase [Nitrospirota bacterium]
MSRIYVFDVPEGEDIEAVIAEYQKDPSVEYAEPNYLVHTTAIPNDPMFSQQWSLNNTGQVGGIADADIDAPEAWNIETGNASVVIAIVDTGVDLTHPDLAGKIIQGYDFWNNDSDPQDDHGHGTHVAGIAAAMSNNNVGIAGVCWYCGILPVKVLDHQGSGNELSVTNGIVWATDNNADIINLSLGLGFKSLALADAVAYAHQQGVVVVAARGNDASTELFYPASYPESISVAATDGNDALAYFSSYGYDLETTAPGQFILSTVPVGSCQLCDPSGYLRLDGTSMAAPHVAGLAGLLLSANPSLSPDEVKLILTSTSEDDIESPQRDRLLFNKYIGWGRINAYDALQISDTPPPPHAPILYIDHQPSVNVNQVVDCRTIGFTAHIVNPGSGTLTWVASTDVPWLDILPTTAGSDPAILVLKPNLSALGVGAHTGTVSVTSPEAINSPQQVEIALNLVDPGNVACIERISVDSNGSEGDNISADAKPSQDGRFVAFVSNANNMVVGDHNETYDVFVHDRETGLTERVSVASDGVEGNKISTAQSISADGRYVTFYSAADNLVPGDTNSVGDVFLHDRQTHTTERVSVDSNGQQLHGTSFRSYINDTGRFIAFESSSAELAPGDLNSTYDVFVKDRATGMVEQVSVDNNGVGGNAYSLPNGISADGRYVLFTSLASNLVAGDTNGTWDLFVRDRSLGITERVNVDSHGGEANGASEITSALSADGRYVAFSSSASNLVPGDTNDDIDAFVHDRLTGTTERVSITSNGGQSSPDAGFYGGDSYAPTISADGRYVAFYSYAINFTPLDTNNSPDIFVHDRLLGTTIRVSVDSLGVQGNWASYYPAISANGRYIAFDSYSSNFVAGDTNDSWGTFLGRDVFVYDRSPDQD